MEQANAASTNESKGNNEHIQSSTSENHPVDAGVLEVVLALAALSVAVVVIPFELPNLVYRWLTIPIVISAIITFIFSYLSFGDLYSKYLLERGIEFPGWWFGQERKFIIKIRLNPYWELWMAIRFFGISLILLLTGIVLNWLLV